MAGFTTTVDNQMQPYVVIVEQPQAKGQRFRYKCEGRSAGSIPGEHSTSENKTYPTIEIRNYSGHSAIVVVSCVTKDNPARPHPHSLVGQDCKEGVCTIRLRGTTRCSFPNIGIQCATRKEVQASLKQREKIRVDPFSTGYFVNTGNIDLNTVCLCFQVFLPDEKNKFTRIVRPVVSQCIFDKKALNDLVICRLSCQAGSAKGGDEVFMLCEKVNKEDIQVRIYEEIDGQVIWEDFGEFSSSDIHRQFAIVFKTPRYRDPFIKEPAAVYIQLKRPSDCDVSDPKPFQYIPDDPDPDGIAEKRKRKAVNISNFFNDTSLPTPIKEESDADMADRRNMTVRDRLIMKATRRNKPAAAAASSAAAAAVPSYSFDNTGFTTAAHTVVQDNILLQGASNTLTFQPTIQAGLQQQTLQEQQMDPNMGQVLSFLNDDIMMVETNDPMENFSGISLPSGFSSGIMGELGDLVGAEETVQPAPAADLNPSS